MKMKTQTKKIQEDLEGCVLPEGLGYKRGYFRDMKKQLVTLECIEEDITAALNEAIIVRPCYDGEKEYMQIPLFFEIIKGVHMEPYRYAKLLDFCKTSSNSVYIQNIKELFEDEAETTLSLLDGIDIADKLNGKSLDKEKLNENLMKILSLHTQGYVPFNEETKEFDIDEILNPSDELVKEYGIIDNLGKFTKIVRKYLVEELNRYIMSKDIVKDIDKYEYIELYKSIGKLKQSIVDKINNYTISNIPPKIIMFKENQEIIKKDESLLLGYLHNIGFDVIVFIPSANDGSMDVLSENIYSELKLPQINNKVNKNYIEKLGELLRGKALVDEDIVAGLTNFKYDSSIEDYKKLLKKSDAIFKKMEKKLFS